MPVAVRQCSFTELSAAPMFGALTDEYAAESAISGLPAPKAHIEGYLALEAAGVMQALGAYLDDELIGLAIVLVAVLPHYSVPVASMESFFVAEKHRKSGAGAELLRAAEQTAIDKGAVGLLVSAPMGGKLADVMAGRSAYSETNRVFFRGFACSP